MSQYPLSPNLQIKIKALKESLRSGNIKFIHKQDFRKDFVRVYESAYNTGTVYGILVKGKIGIMVVKGEVLTQMMEVVDALTVDTEQTADKN